MAVMCSVAGLRGRAKNIFYGSSKSGLITFLSGLRQKFHNKLNIVTIIPGYMSTNSFKESAPNFLITSPKKAATIITKAIKAKKTNEINTLRLIKSAIKDKDIASRSGGKDNSIGDPEIVSLLQNLIKQRKDSIDSFKVADRDDLISIEIFRVGS